MALTVYFAILISGVISTPIDTPLSAALSLKSAGKAWVTSLSASSPAPVPILPRYRSAPPQHPGDHVGFVAPRVGAVVLEQILVDVRQHIAQRGGHTAAALKVFIRGELRHALIEGRRGNGFARRGDEREERIRFASTRGAFGRGFHQQTGRRNADRAPANDIQMTNKGFRTRWA
ncbi:MAG: hypothetical protein IPK17_38175 [Chloroflexi bacterium]|uniref:hypothetical protein n=1 Tax=Candidatus Flexifilum breve TaxID=3140694 RepID=UPI003134A13B|nr:hypothetical protein [Chloroflexota bacterium]